VSEHDGPRRAEARVVSQSELPIGI
jgi:hypothetical protein